MAAIVAGSPSPYRRGVAFGPKGGHVLGSLSKYLMTIGVSHAKVRRRLGWCRARCSRRINGKTHWRVAELLALFDFLIELYREKELPADTVEPKLELIAQRIALDEGEDK
jgi:hypothetical protein